MGQSLNEAEIMDDGNRRLGTVALLKKVRTDVERGECAFSGCGKSAMNNLAKYCAEHKAVVLAAQRKVNYRAWAKRQKAKTTPRK